MKRQKKGSKVFAITVGAVLAFYAFLMLLMIYFTVITSLKSFLDYDGNPIGLPEEWKFNNYIKAFSAFKVPVRNGKDMVYFGKMFLYSFYYAFMSGIFSTIVPCIVAYLVTKYNFAFNKVIYSTVIVSMILPIVGSLPSQIQIAKTFGVYNNLLQPLMAATYLGQYFLVFYATFKGFSREYYEAAEIDGAGQFTVMIKIAMPLVINSIIAVFILQFITFWNDYAGPIIFLQDYPTAAVGLFRYVYNPTTQEASTITLRMAGCMLLFLPTLIVFLCFKNIFMGNLTIGGIKG